MDYTYTAAGRVSQYRSPLNSAFGTKYSRSAGTGMITAGDTSVQTGSTNIFSAVTYLPFGPLASFTTASLQPAGGYSRTLTYTSTLRPDYVLNSQTWSLVCLSGCPNPQPPNIDLLSQTLGYTPGGAITTRNDSADTGSRRYYGYDAL